MKRRAFAAVVFAAAGALFSLVPPVNTVHAEPLRIGIYRGVHCALIYLADAQGFFKKQGLDTAVTEYDTGMQSVNDLVAGKVDIATAAEFVFVLQSFRHPDLRIPGTIAVSSDDELVVRKDRAITRPQDLIGRRVAITRGTSAEFFLHNYLIFNRIPASSVHIVYQTPAEMVKAITEGTIDAALCWAPYAFEMEKQLGTNGARWPGQSGQDYYFALFAKEGFLKKQAKTTERFLAALSEAEQFIAKYPDRAQAIIRGRLKNDAGTFLDAWSHSRFQLQLTQDLIVLMEREAKWAMRNDLAPRGKTPNYLDFFYFEALEKVRPEAVSIVH